MGNNELVTKFCDNWSILVINTDGKLKQVHVPFRVASIIGTDPKRQVFIVEEVLATDKDELVYIINGKPYYHHHFYIDIHF